MSTVHIPKHMHTIIGYNVTIGAHRCACGMFFFRNEWVSEYIVRHTLKDEQAQQEREQRRERRGDD